MLNLSCLKRGFNVGFIAERKKNSERIVELAMYVY